MRSVSNLQRYSLNGRISTIVYKGCRINIDMSLLCLVIRLSKCPVAWLILGKASCRLRNVNNNISRIGVIVTYISVH